MSLQRSIFVFKRPHVALFLGAARIVLKFRAICLRSAWPFFLRVLCFANRTLGRSAPPRTKVSAQIGEQHPPGMYSLLGRLGLQQGLLSKVLMCKVPTGATLSHNEDSKNRPEHFKSSSNAVPATKCHPYITLATVWCLPHQQKSPKPYSDDALRSLHEQPANP